MNEGIPTIVHEKIDKTVEHIEQEARMVLPGIQGLFGFQMMAVFNPGFKTSLSGGEQRIHLLAITFIVLAILLVMAPAAYHRQAEPRQISPFFARFASRSLAIGMFPLMIGICLELFLVAKVILEVRSLAAGIAVGMFIAFLGAWYVFPQSRARSLESR